MQFRTDLVLTPGSHIDSIAASVREALVNYRLVHIVGGPSGEGALEQWSAIARRLGQVDLRGENPVTLDRFMSQWSDIRYDPDLAQAYRHSKTAQPFHTDGSYNFDPPDVALFYCETPAVSGGETTFLDAEALVRIMSVEQPRLLHALQTIPVQLQKGVSAGQRTTILAHDDRGSLVFWNENRVTPGQGEEVDTMVRDFVVYLKDRFTDHPEVASIRLAPGESIAFYDNRVLHGRRPFVAEHRGDRCIWSLFLHFGRVAAGEPTHAGR